MTHQRYGEIMLQVNESAILFWQFKIGIMKMTKSFHWSFVMKYTHILSRNKMETHQVSLSPSLHLLGRLAYSFGTPLALFLARKPLMETWKLLSDGDAMRSSLQAFGLASSVVLALVLLLQWIMVKVPLKMLAALGLKYSAVGLIYMITALSPGRFIFPLARWVGRPIAKHSITQSVRDKFANLDQHKGLRFFLLSLLAMFLPGELINILGGLSSIPGRYNLLARITGMVLASLLVMVIGQYVIR